MIELEFLTILFPYKLCVTEKKNMCKQRVKPSKYSSSNGFDVSTL